MLFEKVQLKTQSTLEPTSDWKGSHHKANIELKSFDVYLEQPKKVQHVQFIVYTGALHTTNIHHFGVGIFMLI